MKKKRKKKPEPYFQILCLKYKKKLKILIRMGDFNYIKISMSYFHLKDKRIKAT